MPLERSKDFKNSTRRLAARLRPGGLRRRRGAASSRSRASRCSSSRRRILGHATNVIVDGVSSGQGIDFTKLHQMLLVALGVYVASAVLSLPAGVPARGRRAAGDVPAALRRRGQAEPHAAAVRRPPAARRHAEPGHQRHRQPRPEPAADAEPAAHVDAHARRRADHDDHDLAAARRWSRSSRSRSRSSR